jgi:hypothetical protein
MPATATALDQRSEATMDLWSAPELHAGLIVGVAAVLAVIAVVEVRRLAGRPVIPAEPWPGGGVLVAACGLVVLAVVRPLPWEVVLGVAGVTAGVDLAVATGQRTWVRAAAAVPFAALIATSAELPDRTWFQLAVVVAIAGGGALAAATDTRWRRQAVAPVLVTGSALGIYAAVPDTEHILAVIGVLVPVALLSWPIPVVRLGAGGAAGTVALVLWAAAYGSRGRPASFLGTVACLGLLAALAVGPRLAPSVPSLLDGLSTRASVVVLGALQAVIALFAARTAGLQSGVPLALLLALPPTALAVTIGAVVRPPPPAPNRAPLRPPPPPRTS